MNDFQKHMKAFFDSRPTFGEILRENLTCHCKGCVYEEDTFVDCEGCCFEDDKKESEWLSKEEMTI